MRGSFNGFQSGDVFDHGRAQFYREEQARQAHLARVARTEFWLSQRLYGKVFESEDAMRCAVVGLAETLGYVMDDSFAKVIRDAVTALWQSGRYQLPAVAA